MNETGWSKSQQVFNKVVVPKNSKSHFQRQSYTLDHVTTVHCAAANGTCLPTMIIYKNCIPKWIHSDGLPSDWIFSSSDTGFINTELFCEWLQNIVVPYAKKCGPPILLIMDQAAPHMSVKSIEMAMNHGIELFALLPGSSSILQPLDQVFFALKLAFSKISLQLCYVAAAFIVNKSKFAKVLVQAQNKAMTSDAIKTAFRKTGIYPFNRYAVDRSKLTVKSSTPSTSSSNSSTLISSTSCSLINIIANIDIIFNFTDIIININVVIDP